MAAVKGNHAMSAKEAEKLIDELTPDNLNTVLTDALTLSAIRTELKRN